MVFVILTPVFDFKLIPVQLKVSPLKWLQLKNHNIHCARLVLY